jgi:hypothetical protein
MVGRGDFGMAVRRLETIAVFLPVLLVVGAVGWIVYNGWKIRRGMLLPGLQALLTPPRWRRPAPSA